LIFDGESAVDAKDQPPATAGGSDRMARATGLSRSRIETAVGESPELIPK